MPRVSLATMLNEGSARLYFLLRHSSRITRHTNAFAMRLPAAEGLLRRKQSCVPHPKMKRHCVQVAMATARQQPCGSRRKLTGPNANLFLRLKENNPETARIQTCVPSCTGGNHTTPGQTASNLATCLPVLYTVLAARPHVGDMAQSTGSALVRPQK